MYPPARWCSWGSGLSRKGPTERYPYGLDRAENLAGIGIAIVIWASAAFAGYESIRKLVDHGTTSHVALGITGAALGIVGNQAVARYKLIVGRRISSATLVADARHSWLDALSLADALVGLIAVSLGFWLGDPIAGLAVPCSSAMSATRSPRTSCTAWPMASTPALSPPLPEMGSFTWTARAAPA
jgi:cation diffusion facilitator family transporter